MEVKVIISGSWMKKISKYEYLLIPRLSVFSCSLTHARLFSNSCEGQKKKKRAEKGEKRVHSSVFGKLYHVNTDSLIK